MKTTSIIKLAIKNLFTHKLRAILTILGVSIGFGSILFLVSLGYGLEELVTNQVAKFDAFTIVDVPAANIQTLEINSDVVSKISSFGHVDEIIPVITIAGKLSKEEDSSTAEAVITSSEKDYWNYAGIFLEKGNFPIETNDVVINESAVSVLGENQDDVIGKRINLTLIISKDLYGEDSDAVNVVENIPVNVVGVSNGNSKTPAIFTNLDLMKSQKTTNFSSLKVVVDNKDSVEKLRTEIENIGLSTEYVGDTVDEISQVFSLFRMILALFGFIALIVASLGMFNTLTISLLERIKEVGLLKALGMKKIYIYQLFLYEAIVISLIGGLLGILIGYLCANGINYSLSVLAESSGVETIKLFVTPSVFSIGMGLFSVLVGILTGWYPARRAIKINALEALKFE